MESSVKFTVRMKLKHTISKKSQACGGPYWAAPKSALSSSPPSLGMAVSRSVSPVQSLRGLLLWDHGTD